jgi:hypothetical protein
MTREATSREAVTHSDAVELPLDPRVEFGARLRDAREEAELSIEDIARTTKIPTRSLEHLEAGRFDALPGDVFVRGFLRSYARCVKLDPESTVSDYALCGLQPAPVSSELAESLLASKRRSRAESAVESSAEGEVADIVDDSDSESEPAKEAPRGRRAWRDAFDLAGRHLRPSASDEPVPRAITAEGSGPVEAIDVAATEEARPARRERIFVPPSFETNSDSNRRGPLTLAVIILVIVATLTMSYLLRRPGAASDGFTKNDGSATELIRA